MSFTASDWAFPMQHWFAAPAFQLLLHCMSLTGRGSLLLVTSVLVYLLTPVLRVFRDHTRKRGRWRHRRYFPRTFLLLSSVALSHTQVIHALLCPPGRVFCVGPLFKSAVERMRRKHDEANSLANMPTQEELFPMCVDKTCPKESFFFDDIFDFLPFEEEAINQGEVPVSLLHLSGFATEWMHEHCVEDPMHADINIFSDSDDDSTCPDMMPRDGASTCSSTDADDDSDYEFDIEDVLVFKRDLLADPNASEAYEYLRTQLSSETVMTPAHQATSTNHLLDPKLYLRQSGHQSYRVSNNQPRILPVLVDTGCSVSCSGYEEDFEGVLVPGEFGMIKTANGFAAIKGFGMVSWHTCDESGKFVIVRVPAYYCPDIQLRLFSPQDYSRYHHMSEDEPTMMGNHAWFALYHQCWEEEDPVIVRAIREPESNLFFFYAENHVPLPDASGQPTSTQTPCKQCNVTVNVHDPQNFNLSPAQKLLLLDHQRLGHFRFPLIRELYQAPQDNTPFFIDPGQKADRKPCLLMRDKHQLTCQIPMCATCAIAKARRRAPKAKKTQENPDFVNKLREHDLQPGDCFSMDQYESSVKGRLPHTRGREASRSRYCGGTIFYDHASTKLFARHQHSLAATHTVNAKRDVERECVALYGVRVKKYHTDNGVFKSREFEAEIDRVEQWMTRSGSGAHHQNAVAERAIGTAQNMARAMLLHMRIHWPEEFDPSLWPFALDYALWIYNHTPQKSLGHFSPDELFSQSRLETSPLRRCRVFGCPAFVLSNRLQDGKKIPKWNPRAKLGAFMGFSSVHSSLVGLILNIETGYVTPQYHVVYDERFETVTADMIIDLYETWMDLWTNHRDFYLDEWDIDVDGPLPGLDPEFDSDSDSDDDDDNDDDNDDGHVQPRQAPKPRRPVTRSQARAKTKAAQPKADDDDELAQASDPESDSSSEEQGEVKPPGWHDVEVNPEPRDVHRRKTLRWVDEKERDSASSEDSGVPDISRDSSFVPDEEPDYSEDAQHPIPMPESSTIPQLREDFEQLVIDGMDDSEPPTPTPMQRGSWADDESSSSEEEGPDRAVFEAQYRPVDSRLFSHVRAVQDEKNLAYVTLNWESVPDESLYQYFHELFSFYVDKDTKEVLDPESAFHPFALASKMESEDYPSFREIMRMDAEEQDRWFDSMDEEIQALFKSGACEFMDREEVLKQKKEIVKSTWAFRKKRKPSGEVTRYKSRMCIRGDLQRNADTYGPNQTFAPTVDWITVRLLFTLGLVEDWKTASIDFKNAFTQASLPEPIFLELPPGYKEANPTLKDKVIKVNTSLYGDVRAANLWYNKIAGTLVDDLGFRSSEMDPCLFIRSDCIIVLYVDDAILMARDDKTLDHVLQELSGKGYQFNRDGDFKSYLGVQLDRLSDGSLKLSQPHLNRSFVDSVGCLDSKPVDTPSSGPLFRHLDSKGFDHSFNYRSAIGMLQYLGQNTRPDCAYAISACSRFCNDPREPHSKAVKRIARYIVATMGEGIIFKPDFDRVALDCHVDADFAGNWNINDPEDPTGVKSRTGFLLTFAGVPVLWKSRPQLCIALSTMESEYIALSTAMRSLVHVRALLSEICTKFDLAYGDKISTISTVFEDNRAAKILATTDPPRLTPRSKSLAVKYHWFRSHLGVKDGSGIILEDVASSLNKADFLTKALALSHFRANRLAVCGW